MSFKPITLEELFAKYKDIPKDELLLDVRSDEEYREGHIPGAQNIAHTDIAAHTDRLKKYKKIYLYCRSGGRVQIATAALMAAGISNIQSVVKGGMPDWIQSGYPVER